MSAVAITIQLPREYALVGFSCATMALVQFGLGARAMSLRHYFKSDEWLRYVHGDIVGIRLLLIFLIKCCTCVI
jgi:hypothetical protein